MPHGRHIYATASDMDMAKICAYPPSQHAFPHGKCVLRCCYNCLCIDIPDKESDMHHSKTSPSISFHIYHLIARCAVHVRHPIDENKICCLCFQYPDTVKLEKPYTRKELVTMETSIADFQKSFYIPEIQKLAFQLPHICIIGTNNCGNTR